MIGITNMDDEVQEEVEEIEEQPQEENSLGLIIAALDGVEDAPDEFELEGWKEQYGNFYVSTIHVDDNLYIWRTLKRGEYKQIIKSGAATDKISYDETVVRRCVLWPKFTAVKTQAVDAGVIETLSKQILFQSGFVPDNIALSLIKVI
jgi:hypothetical protein